MTSIRATGPLSVLLLAFALTSCASTPGANTPGATSTLTPAETAPAERTATALVVGAEGFVVIDTDGAELLAHDWEDEPDGSVVAALDDYFGTAATVSSEPGDCCHMAPFDVYDWGGFQLRFALLDGEPRDTYFLPSTVTATAADVHGIEIRTSGGLTVGSTVDRVLASAPYAHLEYEGIGYFYVDPSDDSSSGLTRTVLLTSGAGSSTVSGLTAPSSPDAP